MEKTRSYIEKGEAPLFFEFSVEGALVHDRVPAPARAALEELVREKGRVVVPQANRGGILELVALAQDEEQSLYRVLWLEQGGRPESCVGFGRVSGTDDTYDCLGLVALGEEEADRALAALSAWLAKAGARLSRFEVDEANQEAAARALSHGFGEEGRIADFYGEGVAQRILVWRPGR